MAQAGDGFQLTWLDAACWISSVKLGDQGTSAPGQPVDVNVV